MSTILTMDKSQIRTQYKELRKQLSEIEVMDKSLTIANRCLELPIWEEQIFHLFLLDRGFWLFRQNYDISKLFKHHRKLLL